jgi:Tol biopolymer transport system component
MTTRRESDPVSPEFDRLMTAWFGAEARVLEPDDLLDRTISRTMRIRSRPAWLLPERWIPMELTMRQLRLPREARYIALLLVLILMATAALLVAGSQRHVPAPFGPAKNGSIYFATNDGDIVAIDAATSESAVLIGHVEPASHPAISLDGLRVAIVRTEADGRHVDVADVDRASTLRVSTTPLASIPHDLAWSPDSRHLAWIADGDLWIAAADGSGSDRVDVGMTVSDIAWRPPTGDEILVRAAPEGRAGLWLMHPDGSNRRAITAIDGTEFMYADADWSPDGERLAYSDVPPNIVHVLTIDGLVDQIVPPRAGSIGALFPKWSPDGTRIALLDWRQSGDGRVAIVNANDLAGPMTNTGPSFSQGPDYVWSPDGEQILAIGWDSDQPWLLDPMGGEGYKTSWALPGDQSSQGGENTLLNVWQRLAP